MRRRNFSASGDRACGALGFRPHGVGTVGSSAVSCGADIGFLSVDPSEGNLSDVRDPYDVRRFVEAAQDGCYEQVCDELRSGRKLGHWIWFIFPQLSGLGSSPTALRYGSVRWPKPGLTWLTRFWAHGLRERPVAQPFRAGP